MPMETCEKTAEGRGKTLAILEKRWGRINFNICRSVERQSCCPQGIERGREGVRPDGEKGISPAG